MSRYIFWLLFSWRGRIERKKFVFGSCGLISTLHILSRVFAHADVLLAITLLLGIWAVFALCVKRLHDLGWTAWWLSVSAPVLGSTLGLLPSTIQVEGFLGYAELLVYVIVPLALLLAILLKSGDPVSNAHGVRKAMPAQLDALLSRRVAATVKAPVFDGTPRTTFGQLDRN